MIAETQGTIAAYDRRYTAPTGSVTQLAIRASTTLGEVLTDVGNERDPRQTARQIGRTMVALYRLADEMGVNLERQRTVLTPNGLGRIGSSELYITLLADRVLTQALSELARRGAKPVIAGHVARCVDFIELLAFRMGFSLAEIVTCYMAERRGHVTTVERLGRMTSPGEGA